MIHFCFLFIFFLTTTSQLFPFTIKELIEEKGRNGDTVVVSQSTMIYTITLNTPSLTFFVTKAPRILQERQHISSWLSWLNQGAQGALETLTVPLEQVPTCYPELGTLLHLDWTPLSATERKKQGPTPLPGEMDFRPFWNPKILLEGQVLAEISSIAYTSQWPNDGSALAQKTVHAYFPANQTTVVWFPYWIEFSGLKKALFVIDSRVGL